MYLDDCGPGKGGVICCEYWKGELFQRQWEESRDPAEGNMNKDSEAS